MTKEESAAPQDSQIRLKAGLQTGSPVESGWWKSQKRSCTRSWVVIRAGARRPGRRTQGGRQDAQNARGREHMLARPSWLLSSLVLPSAPASLRDTGSRPRSSLRPKAGLPLAKPPGMPRGTEKDVSTLGDLRVLAIDLFRATPPAQRRTQPAQRTQIPGICRFRPMAWGAKRPTSLVGWVLNQYCSARELGGFSWSQTVGRSPF